MKLKQWIVAGLFLSITITAVVLGVRWRANIVKMQASGDFSDKDFVADVVPTDKPYIFDVTVRKVTPKARKTIILSIITPILVDFVLTDESGKKYPDSQYSYGEYAEEIGQQFSNSQNVVKVTAATAPFRLQTEKLRPGRYTLEPRVRIYEDGRDAKSGYLSDMGSVAVPSTRSIIVEIK